VNKSCFVILRNNPTLLIKNKRERLKELDILRAIAFIFVVEQHTGGSIAARTSVQPRQEYSLIEYYN
jgi:peptidoglycan/LPS O-acetylase OafA/YrhL